MGKKSKLFPVSMSVTYFPSSFLPLPPCLLPSCSKEKVTEIFEITKGFGWVNLEWVKLLVKNLKDRRGMQSCYINIFWMVPSYAQPWRHNCIKWNFIQKLGKCTGVGWLSALSAPFQTWSEKPRCWRRMWTVPRGSWPNLSKRFSFSSPFLVVFFPSFPLWFGFLHRVQSCHSCQKQTPGIDCHWDLKVSNTKGKRRKEVGIRPWRKSYLVTSWNV